MKEEQFIQKNKTDWQKLEEYIKLLSSNGAKNKREVLHDFIFLYNKSCNNLSYSQTNYSDSNTTKYLNSIVSKAHSIIYETKKSNLRNIFNFFVLDFQKLIYNNALLILFSFTIFLLGFLLSYFITLHSIDFAAIFLPPEYLNPNGDISENSINSVIMSSYIFTNNIKVGFTAFALGVTLGIGTAIVLWKNGTMLGALAAIMQLKGQALVFWSLILPHGIIELFCIFVCGGAGLLLGKSIIKPGLNSRKNSFILGGKISINLVLGTIPLFIIAGIIEGYITPSSLSVEFKYFFSAITLLLLIIYLSLPKLINKFRN